MRLPPDTDVVSLDFEDHPFDIQRFDKPCALCGAEDVYLDEVILDDKAGRMFVCSDTDHCEDRRAHGHAGEMLAPGGCRMSRGGGGEFMMRGARRIRGGRRRNDSTSRSP